MPVTTAADVAQLVRHRLAFRDVRLLAEPVPFHLRVDELGVDLAGWQTSVYHEAFDPVTLQSKRHGLILVPNTYLSSFAYNVVAAWHHYADGSRAWTSDPDHPLARALRFNLKKFYAEQILRRTHNLFGIAVFLETLLYEEAVMYPVLAAVGGPQFADTPAGLTAEELNVISGWLTRLVFTHEVGHVVHDDHFRDRLLENLPSKAHSLAGLWDAYGPAAEEFECDALAVAMALAPEAVKVPLVEACRLTLLGFTAFAALHTLDLSAKATAANSPASSEDSERGNVLSSMSGASYTIETVPALQRDRAYAVRRLVELIAEDRAVDLYSHTWPDVAGDPHAANGRFPISPTLMDDMEEFLPTIIEGTDPRVRGKCEMLARALHGHPEGIDYLAWRSKTFSLPAER